VCQEEEIAITGASTAVTVVPVVAIFGERIANVKGWEFFRGGESK